MTEEPCHSPSPVVNAITGFFIAFAMITAPIAAITRVKLPHRIQPSIKTTQPKVLLKTNVTFKTELRQFSW